MSRNPVEIHFRTLIPAMLALMLGASGCRAVGAIFKAGIWTGVIVIFVALALVLGAIRLLRRPA